MSTSTARPGLAEHLKLKGDAMRESAVASPRSEDWAETVSARSVADDLTGVRKLSIREWRYIGDGGPAFGGWNLGPSSPELLCGVASTCFCHTYLIGAAWLGIPVDRVDVKVESSNNDAWFFGIHQEDPKTPFDFRIRVEIRAPQATEEQKRDLTEYAESKCPLLAILRQVTDLHIDTVYSP
jgi:uncharacterized OsmC-like protein